MDKEQIMIDGVDISGCEFIDEWKHCDICNSLIKTVYPNATKCLTEQDLRCETYQNCHYKQLKRKEQECEKYEQLFDELDKRVSIGTKIFDCIVVSKIVKDIINKAKGEE